MHAVNFLELFFAIAAALTVFVDIEKQLMLFSQIHVFCKVLLRCLLSLSDFGPCLPKGVVSLRDTFHLVLMPDLRRLELLIKRPLLVARNFAKSKIG